MDTGVERLRALLGDSASTASEFNRRWARLTLAPALELERSYRFLVRLGMSKADIVDQGYLLCRPQSKLYANYQMLRRRGISRDRIVSYARLLALNPPALVQRDKALRQLGVNPKKQTIYLSLLVKSPRTLARRVEVLRSIGFDSRAVAANSILLGNDESTLLRNYANLKALVGDTRLVTNAHLLALSPATIVRRWQSHRRLLDRATLRMNPPLLGIPRETLEANVDFLVGLGIDYRYNNGILLMTNVMTKRRKLLVLLRQMQRPANVGQNEETAAWEAVIQTVRRRPKLLVRSVASLERTPPMLLQRQ